MTGHYSIGLTERDRVNTSLGGGLPTGSIVLLEGEYGAGKSVISQRVAYGLAEERTPTTYVSTELAAPEFIEQMESLAYGVVDHLLAERLLFLRADVNTYGGHELGGSSGPTDEPGSRDATRQGSHGRRAVDGGDTDAGEANGRELLARLTGADILWRGDVLIVDAFSAFLQQDPRFDAIRDAGDEDHAMQSFVAALRRRIADGTTVVLTVDPSEVTDRALAPLRSVADVYLDIQTNAVGQDIRRSVLVRRFAGMRNQVDDSIGFAVQQGRGLTIESRTVA